jgi:hypothetical protein
MPLGHSRCLCGRCCPNSTPRTVAPRPLGQLPSNAHTSNVAPPPRRSIALTLTVAYCMASQHGQTWAGARCGPAAVLPHRTPTGGLADANCAGPHPLCRDITCRGYVGQGTTAACEYHECDFDWHEHAATVRHIVEAQKAQALAMRLRQQAEATSTNSAGSTASAPTREQAGDGQQAAPQSEPLVEGGSASMPMNSGRRLSPAGPSASGAASAPLPVPLGSLASHQPQAYRQPQLQRQEQEHEQDLRERTSGSAACNSAAVAMGNPGASATVTGDKATAVAGTAHLATVPHAHPSGPAPRGWHQTSGDSTNPHSGSSGEGGRSTTTSKGSRGAPTAAGSGAGSATAGGASVYEGDRWEQFYQAHPTARFFKERRYLLLEFPELLRMEHVAEIGCGCGSSILPVLKANPASRTTCTGEHCLPWRPASRPAESQPWRRRWRCIAFPVQTD